MIVPVGGPDVRPGFITRVGGVVLYETRIKGPVDQLTYGNRARESRGIASAQKAAPRNDDLLDVIVAGGPDVRPGLIARIGYFYAV